MSYISENLRAEISIPSQGILSRTLHNDDFLKVVLFGFSEGHELSAHAAPMPATIQILEGSAEVTLGATTQLLDAGAFVYMEPKLTHGIVAKTPMVMVLLLWKSFTPGPQ